MTDQSRTSTSYREFDLNHEREFPSKRTPASHQVVALDALNRWFESPARSSRGGIVVLPTGGGKTFTAVRFLCRGPLSYGYKVLWLAHTHHLLDQAYRSFAPLEAKRTQADGFEIGLIAETRTSLNLRVVSGTPGHFPPHSIKPSDDVVIATLQTMAKAVQNREILHGFDAWLKGATNLVVVFDEAHHSPAPSYRTLLEALRETHPSLLLLGLTATPTHTDEGKRGWLKRLFPQGILHQVSAKRLMLDGILARPVFETCDTKVTPEWNEKQYQKWVGTYSDLPESIITDLAKNRDRNALIAKTYADNKSKYGKTIIFAERWFQCEQLSQFLDMRGVRAGAVYTHEDSGPSTVDARNRRDKDANEQALQAFRRGELDVLINVRMLTEGTDVPDVQSVFLTRQTTSRILLTQMVGRAMRGPKFGGTATAYVVSFNDNWEISPPFATFDLEGGGVEETGKQATQRAPLQLISIELVRQLARATDRGSIAAPGPYASMMPLGWYATTFDSQPSAAEDGGERDDIETVRDLVLVFDRDERAYEQFIGDVKSLQLTEFTGERVTVEMVRAQLEQWNVKYFKPAHPHELSERLRGLLDIVRHVAQRSGSGEETAPPFVPFEARRVHDLDLIAQGHIDSDLGHRAANEALLAEFGRTDRLWKVIYPHFDTFKAQYQACVNRLINPTDSRTTVLSVVARTPEAIPDREPSEQVKKQVKERDGNKCLCCGEDKYSLMQVDHIVSWYSSGNNSIDNLQTLCKTCNTDKKVNEMNFRLHRNLSRTSPSSAFPAGPMPSGKDVKESVRWERVLRRHINCFYACGAVHKVIIGARGTAFYEWAVELYEGNEPDWVNPFLKDFRNRIRQQIGEGRSDGLVMERLIVTAPDKKSASYPARSRR